MIAYDPPKDVEAGESWAFLPRQFEEYERAMAYDSPKDDTREEEAVAFRYSAGQD